MNKQKEGTVYTPENIANYITKTTIERFLLEKINNKFSTEISKLSELFEKDFRKNKTRQKFVELSIPRSDRERLEYIFEVAFSLKVIDPAVGSGRFIIAALKILEGYYLNLKSLGIINWSNYKIREYIISNSLFGVDIENEAIVITNRRLLSTLEDLSEAFNSALSNKPSLAINNIALDMVSVFLIVISRYRKITRYFINIVTYQINIKFTFILIRY